MRKRPLVLVGDSVFAQIAFEYFNFDSPYEVVAFSVEEAYLKQSSLFNRPIVPLEAIEQEYPPADNDVFVSLVFTQFNRLRTRLYLSCKARGYRMASYVSSRARIRPGVTIGEHCFVCEDNVIQPFSALGSNVILWSGNQICHRSFIDDNCFILPNSMLSDGVFIGRNSIVGANVAIGSKLTIGPDCWIGPAMVVTENLAANSVVEVIATGNVPVVPTDNKALQP